LTDNLTAKQNPEWSLFLPALSSFYASGIGKQREGRQYFDPARIPTSIPDIEALNFLNEQKALFPYRWFLYSAGHADLVTYKTNPNESIIAKRDRENTFMLADSGGFQIMKGQWPADWKDPACPKAMAKRKVVLDWMEENADYAMILDIPTQTIRQQHIFHLHGIKTIADAVTATHINNQYFINNRKKKCKLLNVLQGLNHAQSDDWYLEMRDYCDPTKYPETHFDGWAFGGQTKTDIHLFLKRLTHIIYDGLLQEGVHDWIHCLGTSILEWSALFSDVQRVVRKYHNPKLTISFDCASPFYAASKGLAYNFTLIEHGKKWTYAMEKTADNKNYSQDTRPYSQACLQDKVHTTFTDSPVSVGLKLNEICPRGWTAVSKFGKPTKTSWDTMTYTLVQAHNAYTHIKAVQDANTAYDSGVIPSMLMHNKFNLVLFSDVIESIFSKPDRQSTLDEIERYSWFWLQFKSSGGFSGKRVNNALTQFNQLFSVDDTPDDNYTEDVEEDPYDEPTIEET
jgi:hypothetical protein